MKYIIAVSRCLKKCASNVDIDKYQCTMLSRIASVIWKVGSHHGASSTSKLQIKSMMQRANSCKKWQVIC